MTNNNFEYPGENTTYAEAMEKLKNYWEGVSARLKKDSGANDELAYEKEKELHKILTDELTHANSFDELPTQSKTKITQLFIELDQLRNS